MKSVRNLSKPDADVEHKPKKFAFHKANAKGQEYASVRVCTEPDFDEEPLS